MFSLSKEHIADFLLLSVTVFWGSTFIIVKEAISLMPTFAFLSIRFWIASILLCLIFFRKLKYINAKLIIDGVVLGIVLFLAYAFQTVALKYEKASIVGFLTGLNVIFTPILSAFLIKRVPSVFSQIGSVLAFLGMGLMSFKGGLSLSVGDVLTIICAVFVAVQIVLTDRYSRKHDTYLLTVVEITVLAILSTLTNIVFEPYLFPKQWNIYLVGAFLITSVFATVYAFVVQNTAQKYTTPTKTAIIFIMEPVFAAMFGYFVGNEVLSFRAYVGALIMFIGLFVAEVGPSLVAKERC